MQTLPATTLRALFAIAAQSLITVCSTMTAMTTFLIGVFCFIIRIHNVAMLIGGYLPND